MNAFPSDSFWRGTGLVVLFSLCCLTAGGCLSRLTGPTPGAREVTSPNAISDRELKLAGFSVLDGDGFGEWETSLEAPASEIYAEVEPAPLPVGPDPSMASIRILRDEPVPDLNEHLLDDMESPLMDGLESRDGWGSPRWGSPVRIGTLTPAGPPAVGRILTIDSLSDLKAGEKGVAQYSCRPPFKSGPNSAIRLQAMCREGERMQLAVAVTAGKDFTYYESEAVPLSSVSWKDIHIPFGRSVWKSAGSQWEFKSSVPEGAEIMQVMVLVYGASADSRALVDGLQLVR